MLTSYQKMLVNDLSSPNSYGKPLLGWDGRIEFFRSPAAPPAAEPLAADLAATFIENSYFLVRINRVVTVYRGFETAGLRAPFGVDHPSFIHGLTPHRKPGRPDGWWWSPGRPSMAIDDLRPSDMHRGEHRDSNAVKLKWNRLDVYLESELLPGELVYVGRAAPQQESALYGGAKYSGGGTQFRLTRSPLQALPRLKQYRSA